MAAASSGAVRLRERQVPFERERQVSPVRRERIDYREPRVEIWTKVEAVFQKLSSSLPRAEAPFLEEWRELYFSEPFFVFGLVVPLKQRKAQFVAILTLLEKSSSYKEPPFKEIGKELTKLMDSVWPEGAESECFNFRADFDTETAVADSLEAESIEELRSLQDQINAIRLECLEIFAAGEEREDAVIAQLDQLEAEVIAGQEQKGTAIKAAKDSLKAFEERLDGLVQELESIVKRIKV